MNAGEHRKLRIVAAALLATALALGGILIAATPVAGATAFRVCLDARSADGASDGTPLHLVGDAPAERTAL